MIDMSSRARRTDETFAEQDELIGATVRALAGAAQMSQNQVAERVGLSKSTFSRRMHDGFLASDVMRLALLFGVPVGDIYDGLGGAIRVPVPGSERGSGRATTGRYLQWGLAA